MDYTTSIMGRHFQSWQMMNECFNRISVLVPKQIECGVDSTDLQRLAHMLSKPDWVSIEIGGCFAVFLFCPDLSADDVIQNVWSLVRGFAVVWLWACSVWKNRTSTWRAFRPSVTKKKWSVHAQLYRIENIDSKHSKPRQSWSAWSSRALRRIWKCLASSLRQREKDRTIECNDPHKHVSGRCIQCISNLEYIYVCV